MMNHVKLPSALLLLLREYSSREENACERSQRELDSSEGNWGVIINKE